MSSRPILLSARASLFNSSRNDKNEKLPSSIGEQFSEENLLEPYKKIKGCV